MEVIDAGCKCDPAADCIVHYSTRKIWRLSCPVDGTWAPIVHSACLCNEFVSARNRVIGKVNKPTPYGLSIIRRVMKRKSKIFPHIDVMCESEFLMGYSGAKREVYTKAFDDLRLFPFNRNDAYISSFVKSERINPNDKINPDPRMISARGPRYNCTVGLYLKPIEHRLYTMIGPKGSRCIAKGLNCFDRAKLVIHKWNAFSRPVALSLDCSRWDKHVSRELLQIEHSFYVGVYHDQFLKHILDMQLHNRCKTRNGIKYIAEGRRMSGDMNTAMGNCLLMCAMVEASFGGLGIGYDYLDDGDDCLVFLERGDLHIVRNVIPKMFIEFGMELKLENIAYVPEHIKFCQARPVYDGSSWRMLRDPYRTMSGGCTGFSAHRDRHLVHAMFTTIGDCELALCNGMPIMQSYALALKRHGRGVVRRVELNLLGDVYRRAIGLRPNVVGITVAARISFMEAYGLTPTQQIDIETQLDMWDIDITDVVDLTIDLNHYEEFIDRVIHRFGGI